MKTVLLTGITGFLGSHAAIQLLQKGYKVIGTLRDLSRKVQIEQTIQSHVDVRGRLGFAEIDLLSNEEAWVSVMRDADYVIHVASPFPTTLPKTDAEIVKPAKEGTLCILRAATTLGIKRVVMTSSSGTAVYGVRKVGPFTEADWTDISNRQDTTPYFRSKTIAEKAAWDFVNNTPGAPELVTILPGAILGPVLEKDFGTSANIVKKMMDGSMPAVPKIGFEMVDVRSVADAHIKALENPQAAGNRYLCANGYLTFKEVTQVLKQHYPHRKIPTKTLPDFLVKVFSAIDKETKPVINDLGTKRTIDNSKIIKELNWEPIPLDQSITDCAASLIDQEILK